MEKTPKEILRDQNRIGIAVELRNGERFVCFNQCLLGTSNKVYHIYGDFDDDLRYPRYKGIDDQRTVMRIFEYDLREGVNSVIKNIWERKEPVKMTLEEIEEELGYKIQIVGGE